MLAQYLHHVLNYVAQHPVLGELFAFFISFLESLPIIGTIVPGSVTMTAVGVLVGASVLPGFLTVFAACLGAFAGDALGFWLGHRYKQELRTMWPLKKYPKLLTISENFFQKHGGKSILIGRFVGPIRSTIPMVAGILKMRWLRFISAAIPSAICWAFLYMTPGILIGALSMELPPGKTTEFILYGFVTLLLIWLILWTIHHFFKQLAKFINQKINTLWDWMSHHTRSNGIIRFITNQNSPEDHHQLTLLLTASFSLLLFLVLFFYVILHAQPLVLNSPIFNFLQSIHNAQLTHFFVAMTCIGSSITLFSFIIIVALLIQKDFKACAHVVSILIVTAAAVFVFKHLSHSNRPLGFLIPDHSFSFPSGHTTLTLTMLGMLAYLTAVRTPKNTHRWIYLITSLPIILVALSRLYLGVHWFTDIIGATLLSFTLLLISILLQRRHQAKITLSTKQLIQWLTTIILALVVSTSLFWLLEHKKIELASTPMIKQTSLSYNNWWQTSHQHLPIYRNSRFGHPIVPLNLQVAAPLTALRSDLLTQGWQTIKHIKPTTPTNLQKKTTNLAHPLFPWLHHNRTSILFLIKPLPNTKKNIQLRLWKSDYNFSNRSIPLFIGTINYYSPSDKIIHLKHKTVSFQHNAGMQYLLHDLKQYKFRIITHPIHNQPHKIKQLDWNGNVVLITTRKR